MCDELWSLGAPLVNVLLIGPDVVTRPAAEVISRERKGSVLIWQPGDPFRLPDAGVDSTLLMHDVGSLHEPDQARLLRWLDGAAGRSRCISTTARPILPEVLRGAFLETLYYRLNTVCLAAPD